MRRSTAINVALVLGIVLIVVVALGLGSRKSTDGESFVGTDSAATSQIEKDNPDYTPWFTSVFSPGSSEIESGLFALQAALGGVALGYCFGALRSRRRSEATPVRSDSVGPG